MAKTQSMARSPAAKLKRPPRWRLAHDASVEVSEQDGVLSLHLGSELIQSAMRITRPNDLELTYTRCMMGFLLFTPEPRDIVMIGLGGGSLARFAYYHLPKTRIAVVEINAQVIAAARNFFPLPPEGERLLVIEGEGADFVAAHPGSCDVLMIDGFDDGALPATLSSDAFFTSAVAAVRPNGVLVMNLLGRDHRLNIYLKHLQACVESPLLRMKAEPDDNVVVFALKGAAGRRRTMGKRPALLEKKLGLPFRQYAKSFGF
jgi:spermidine synthase